MKELSDSQLEINRGRLERDIVKKAKIAYEIYGGRMFDAEEALWTAVQKLISWEKKHG